MSFKAVAKIKFSQKFPDLQYQIVKQFRSDPLAVMLSFDRLNSFLLSFLNSDQPFQTEKIFKVSVAAMSQAPGSHVFFQIKFVSAIFREGLPGNILRNLVKIGPVVCEEFYSNG